MDDRQLLTEVEDILQSIPDQAKLRHHEPENFVWFGRVKAALNSWDPIKSTSADLYISSFLNRGVTGDPFFSLMTLIHQARAELRNKLVGPRAVAFDANSPYDYFDSLRKIVSQATSDILFVDPYINADVVSHYFPHIKPNVKIRLLTDARYLSSLIPAAKLFCQQHQSSIDIRTNKFHDRFVFLDSRRCYQSGASFKDGAQNSPSVISEIVDAAATTFAMYEQLWISGTQHSL